MGCWQVAAKGSSWQRPAQLCRCRYPTRRPRSRPRPSWRGWQRWMCCCVRVAGKAGCMSRQCSRGWGGCQRRPPRLCPHAGGRRDSLARCHKSAAVCRPLQTRQGRCCALQQYRRAGISPCHGAPRPVRRICAISATPNSTYAISEAIICACIRTPSLQTPMPPTSPSSGRRFSPTRFICRC